MFRSVLLVALLVMCAVARPKLSVGDQINDSIPIGTLEPTHWNQTTFTMKTDITEVPISSIWFYFADTNTGKPLPGGMLQRGSVTLTSSNNSVSIYNALTDSLNVPRVFAASYPLLIPKGSVSVHASWALAAGQAPVTCTLSWAIITTKKVSLDDVYYAEHASIMVPTWSSTGSYSASITATLPYDGLLAWAVGNVLSGGTRVRVFNNDTGAVLCSSLVDSSSGQMQPCTQPPAAHLPSGTKLQVTVEADGTFEPNAGGMDLYFAKLPPPPTTSTTHSAATTHDATTRHDSTTATTGHDSTTRHATTAATTTHSTTHGSTGGGSTGGGSTGGGSSGGGSSGGGSTGSTSGATISYSSGSSGSGSSSGGGEGFLAEVDSIFVQQSAKESKKIKIVVAADQEEQGIKIAEVDEVLSNTQNDEKLRVVEEKASQKFL